jgi:hypothetical protein
MGVATTISKAERLLRQGGGGNPRVARTGTAALMRRRETGFLRYWRLRQIKAGRPVCSKVMSVPSGSSFRMGQFRLRGPNT